MSPINTISVYIKKGTESGFKGNLTLKSDDEPLSRMGLESMIPWDKLDYHLLGHASNGEEVLRWYFHDKGSYDGCKQ